MYDIVRSRCTRVDFVNRLYRLKHDIKRMPFDFVVWPTRTALRWAVVNKSNAG